MFYYYVRSYNYPEFYFPVNLRNRRRGQRLAHAKFEPFWDRKMRNHFPVLTFEPIDFERDAFNVPQLTRKRCIGEIKRDVQIKPARTHSME